MKLKKILSLLLVVVMMVTMLAACSDNKKPTKTTQTETSDQPSEFDEIDSYVASLASSNTFGGAKFNIICRSSARPEHEEEIGNLENDALYKRQRDLEESFDIDIEYVACTGDDYGGSPTSEVADKVYTDVMAGQASYDLIEGNFTAGGLTMLNNGCIRSVEDLDYIDFERSWWMNDLLGQFSIGDHLYFLTGKISPDHFTDPWCIIFNKEVAENYNLPDLYEIVEEDEWTIDKMVEVSSVIPANSGVYRTKIPYYNAAVSFYFSGGFEVCDVDDEGNISLPTSLPSTAVDYIQKLAGILGDESTCYVTDKGGKDAETHENMMPNGEVLFLPSQMGDVAALREKDVEIGVLPMPKSSTDQKDYISFVGSGYNAAVYVARQVKDLDMTSVVIEAMAALSEKHLEPAYYEKSLKGRSTYDPESRRMLDIIYTTKKIDFADIYEWGDLVESLNLACYGASDGFVSSYAGTVRFANIQIKRLMDTISKYEE